MPDVDIVMRTCRACEGSKTVEKVIDPTPDSPPYTEEIPCEVCNATGEVEDLEKVVAGV